MIADEEKNEQEEQQPEAEEAPEETPAAEEEEASAEEEAPAAEAEEAPAEEAGEASAAEEAPAEEELTPKQRRKLERSAAGPAGPQRSPQQRASQRAERRRIVLVVRRRDHDRVVILQLVEHLPVVAERFPFVPGAGGFLDPSARRIHVLCVHIAERHAGLLPADANGRARAITWMFAALNTVEPPIVEAEQAAYAEGGMDWYAMHLAIVDDRIRSRLDDLSARLGEAEWLDGAFSAGDLMMVTVLRRLESSGLLKDYPSLSAFIARGEARPAYQRAFADQLAVFTASQTAT